MSINATLIGQMITFALFVWFTMKLVWPPIMQALEERQTKIADGLAAAERGQRDLELAQHKVSEQLRDAKIEAGKIIDNANKRGSDLVEESKRQARDEGKRLVELAKSEIEQERSTVRQALSKETAAMALLAAERIIGREINDPTNNSLIEEVINEL